jgi:hypothetical protein
VAERDVMGSLDRASADRGEPGVNVATLAREEQLVRRGCERRVRERGLVSCEQVAGVHGGADPALPTPPRGRSIDGCSAADTSVTAISGRLELPDARREHLPERPGGFAAGCARLQREHGIAPDAREHLDPGRGRSSRRA